MDMNFPGTKSIAICILFCSLACNQKSKDSSSHEEKTGTYSRDASFLRQYTKSLVELHDKENKSKILVSAEYQGRVMTSTAMGDAGISFGWINYKLISSGK